MTAQSIVCGTCAAAVPYGRLSCPSCGELLASVVGARRPSSALSATSVRPDVPYDAESAPLSSVIEAPELGLNGGLRDPDAELPWAGAAEGPPVELDHREEGIDNRFEDDLDGLLGPDGSDEPQVDSSSTAGHAWAIAGASMTGPATPAYMPRPNHSRAAAAAAAATTPPVNEPPPAPPIDPPGAYVPPLPAAAIPAGPPAPARAWAGYGSETDTAASAAAASNGKKAQDRALDSSRVAEFIGSVSVAGAALASVGFLLPWASVMIGASGSAYFDRWGLAGPGHVIVVIGILAILGLSIVRNPIPSWIRTGLGGLGVGALLLGLTWPYLLGPLDASPGVLIDAIGAIALIGSGILALVTDRHEVVAKPV